MRLTDAILDAVMKNIKHLSWQCRGCPDMDECDEQPDGREPRFCEPLIEAAILGHDGFETIHFPEKKKGNV